MSLVQCTRQFWQWFSENEEKLSDLIANPDRMGGSEDTVAFINRGITLLHNNLQFNMGGGHEFTFAVSGEDERFIDDFAYRFKTAMGLKRNSAGGSGGKIPPPYESTGGGYCGMG